MRASNFISEGLMQSQTTEQLAAKKCSACEGEASKYSTAEAAEQVKKLLGWRLTHDGLRIRRDWTVKDFLVGLEFFNSVGKLAEEENHHPDLHLENYRNAWIEIWTHSIGGLSENDFILAAKIDRLPVKLKKTE
jgi:4a-hydroxytetrahydrobiopterin dehydratase